MWVELLTKPALDDNFWDRRLQICAEFCAYCYPENATPVLYEYTKMFVNIFSKICTFVFVYVSIQVEFNIHSK